MRLVAIALAEVVTVLALLLVAGQGPWSGRQLLAIDDAHGIHAGDIPIFGLWALGMYCCVWLWREGAP